VGGEPMLLNSDWRAKLSQPIKQPGFTKRLDDRHRFIIEVSGSKTDKVAAMIAANQGKIHRELKLMPSLAVELPYFSMEELARFWWVKKIWHDAPVAIDLNSAVPAVGGLTAQKMGLTGKGVVIAVLDTGIHPHPDLTLPENRIVTWHDLVNQRTNPYDDNGHGTHVAGIIAGNGRSSWNRYRGIAPEALLVGVKVLDENGGGTISNLLSGIEWCLDHFDKLKIKVINLSLGTPAQESYRLDPICRATTAAWRKGITVCAAAGNEGPERKTINSPGINPKIITVGNMDDHETPAGDDDKLNRTSGRGPTIDNIAKPDLLAPGTNITSLKVPSGYRTLSGTSMSTPLVSGAAALMIQKWTQIRPDRVKQLLTQNARSLGLGVNQQGAGVLDLGKIFQANTHDSSNTPIIATEQPQIHSQINQNNLLAQIFGYQALTMLTGKMEPKIDIIRGKRNGLIQKTLRDLKSYLKTPLKQILGYHVLQILMGKLQQNAPIIRQKRDGLIREAVLKFFENHFDS
jgi:serine protease AprX